MTVFELVAKIALDDTDYSAAVDRAKTKAESAKESLSKIGTAAKDAGKTFAKIGTGIAAAGTAVFAFANKVTQTGDNIDKMSQKLGISAEAYQEWDFILTHCGASVEGLQTSMKTLANAAADGTDSTKAAFEKLGLSMDEVSAMSQEDLFSAVITQLQNMGESTERTAIAADLLGRSATELGPVFNMSAEETEALRQQVHDLSAVMSDEAVKNSAAFQDAMTDVKTAFSGAANTLAEELIPHITDLMNNIAAFVANGGLQKIIDGFNTLAPVVAAATAAFVAYKAASAISGVIDALRTATESQTLAQLLLNAAMNANPFVLVATLIAGLVTALVTLWHTNEGFRDAVQNIWSAITGFFTGAWDTIRGVWDKVTGFFGGIWNGIKDTFSGVKGWFSEKFTSAKEAASNAWSNVKSKFGEHWNNIKGAFSEAGGWFSTNFQNFRENALNAWSNIKSRFSDVWDRIKSAFSIGDALSWGRDMLQNFINGIGQKIGALVDKVKGIGRTIKNFLGFSEPKEGPLSNFHTYAPDMMKLFAKGIADNEDVITNQLEKSFAFQPTISSAMGDYRGSGSYGAALSGATFNITVNGANIQDDQSLAERIAFEIQQMVDRKEAMFGAA